MLALIIVFLIFCTPSVDLIKQNIHYLRLTYTYMSVFFSFEVLFSKTLMKYLWINLQSLHVFIKHINLDFLILTFL